MTSWLKIKFDSLLNPNRMVKTQLANSFDKETEYENTIREKDALIESLNRQLSDVESCNSACEKYLFKASGNVPVREHRIKYIYFFYFHRIFKSEKILKNSKN